MRLRRTAGFFLAAPALLKRYSPQIRGQVLDQLFGVKPADGTLTTSSYRVLEGASIARRSLKGRLLNRCAYNMLTARFLDDASNLPVTQLVSDDLTDRAVNVAEKFALRPGGTVQLASALVVKGTIPSGRVVVVVRDRELYYANVAVRVDANLS